MSSSISNAVKKLGIFGGSGSGKSMMIHAIAGLLPEELQASGSVELDGQNILGLPEKVRARLRGRRIATIFQEPMTALDPIRRIDEQIKAPMVIHGIGSRQDRRARVAELLTFVGLPPSWFAADRYPHELSGGQRQRVLIAAALAADPDILLADEPTTALDTVVQRQILDLLNNIVLERRMALVLVSHDLAVISRICGDVLVMNAGRLAHPKPVDRIRSGGAVRTTVAENPVQREETALPLRHDNEAEYLLTAKMISHGYRLPDRSRRIAVDEVSFGIRNGESVGLVGTSGSGKSTLARLLTGLEVPDVGSVEVGRQALPGSTTGRHLVQMVFQDPMDSLDPRWKVGRIVGEPLDRDRLVAAECERRILNALTEVDLPHDAAQRYVHSFSGGQRQRIAIARALVARPRLVVLDEPLSALDAAVRDQILALLADLRERHDLAYLLISHDLSVVRLLCTRVLVLEKGRIVEEGPVETVLTNPRSRAARALLEAVLSPAVAPQHASD